MEMIGVDNQKHTIVYIVDYGKNFGGAANTLLQQAVLMKKAGHRVILLFSDYFGSEMNEEYKEICMDLSIEYNWATYRLTAQPEDIDVVCIDKHYEELRDKIASYHPDILHSVQLNSCVELISRELKIPHIMNIYPLLPEFFNINYMDIFPHYHLCDSWYYARKWQYYLHTDSACIRTVVNVSNQGKNKLISQPLSFICVGAVYEGKNQLSVIKAFHKALANGIQAKLTLCGYLDGNYGNECVQYIEENHLQNEVIIKGFCLDMPKEYSQNDILICGSKRESYPNAVSEAMANGLVVISTPVGGVPEIIKDRKNGYLARDYSEDALLEKIMQVQDDVKSGRIEWIQKRTEETFLENHSPQAIMNQLLQYYHYVLMDYKANQTKEWNKKLIYITDFRSVFIPLLKRFQENKEHFTDSGKVLQKIWYLYHIKNMFQDKFAEQRDFYIWGAGLYGISAKEMLEMFLPEIHLKGFLDSNKTGEFLGYKIYKPNEILRRENVIIFVAVWNGQDKVIEQLNEAKKVFNKDCFILTTRIW